MWGRPKIQLHFYEGPSTFPDSMTPFQWRKFLQVTGPFPVIMKGRYAGFEKKQWFDPHRAVKRTFAVYYGYNPRCCHKGTWNKPGTGHWMEYKPYYKYGRPY